MSSQEFQATHESIFNIGKLLLQYLNEFREGCRSQGDKTEGLQCIEDNINYALEALQAQKYQVAVIAAMKAGKSTFLNAVIGADVLASETAACTVCRTDVRHIQKGQTPKLLEYREGKRQPFIIAEGDVGEIQQKFLLRTREIREKGNPENTTRFEIEHPIEAINSLSSLAGFTLVDTPGPNEWESANFNTVALKQTALEALRTCNAILFILNYTSYKDNAVSDLFKDVVENRQEILLEDMGKIYFILNKVDQKTEKDREISDVINDLKRELSSFGFPNPIIYSASSRQGLLAKLIQQDKATESQIKDFEDFFSAKYAERDEKGRKVIPLPSEIAPRALKDSGIITIQETVIQTITQNAGWNLLNDVLAKLDKGAKAIEDTLNTRISGWEMAIDTLKQKVEDYKKRCDYTKSKVAAVKKSVEEQKQILTSGFIQGVKVFAEGSKSKIETEIDQIAESVSRTKEKRNKSKKNENISQDSEIPSNEVKVGFSIPTWIPFVGGASFMFETKTPLVEAFKKVVSNLSDGEKDIFNSSDSYIIRVKTKEEAQKIGITINEFCSPHIQSWWLNTQDKLVREGTRIRAQLVENIKADIQQISNELSNYLGQTLEVELNINPIQFPDFEFPGIDAKIEYQQEVFKRTQKEERRESRCCSSDKVYYVDVDYEDKREFYEVNLRQTAQLIKQKIDEQVYRNEKLLQRVIEEQISEDFKNAEQQINDYIKRFQDDFELLLKERDTTEVDTARMRTILKEQKVQLTKYLYELTSIRASLDSWKPVQTIK